jgi:hypothetical protein
MVPTAMATASARLIFLFVIEDVLSLMLPFPFCVRLAAQGQGRETGRFFRENRKKPPPHPYRNGGLE